jgi:uncharacterized protein YegJ (DUF2314 family)
MKLLQNKTAVIFLVIFIGFFIYSLSQKNPSSTQDDIISVENSDKEMNQAIATAKETVPTFIENLNNPLPTKYDFSIKVPLETQDGGHEHVWVSDVSYKNNAFTGVIASEVLYTDSHKQGDSITVKSEDISDWTYTENGKIKGAYTLRVLMNRMSEKEKKQFIKNMGASFE